MALFTSKKGEKKSKEAKPRHAQAKRSLHGGAHEILRAPWFSEKALLMTEKGVYAFSVPKGITKAEIAGAVKEIYNVSPRAVRLVNLPGKTKSLRTRPGEGTRAARRKAYVYLNVGETIQFA